MFKNKKTKPIEKQVVVEPKVSNPLVHMVDVNMAITRSKVTKEHVFKGKEPIKKSHLLTRKMNKDSTNLLSKLFKKCKQRTHYKIWFQRRKHNEYKLGMIVRIWGSTKPIVSQSLFVSPINKIMYVKQI